MGLLLCLYPRVPFAPTQILASVKEPKEGDHGGRCCFSAKQSQALAIVGAKKTTMGTSLLLKSRLCLETSFKSITLKSFASELGIIVKMQPVHIFEKSDSVDGKPMKFMSPTLSQRGVSKPQEGSLPPKPFPAPDWAS